ncbi:MAG: FecR domain-containing protein [Opitutales bacterium]|nr:FecR domain-containing protein [Opitutales bacterium]
MKDKEFQDLIDQSLNETISEVDLKALEERMLQDPKARIHYLNLVGLHASLRRRFSTQQEGNGTIPFPRKSIFTRKTVWAIAACLVLFFGMLVLQISNRPFAEVAHVIGAYRADGVIYKTGETVESGILSLTRGLLRLDFSNGARVTVQGPAELEVFDENRILLHQGLVTATIPKSAVGFVVDTVAAHVVDLGTSFGVSVSENGHTEVCVFDGEVEVSLPSGDGAGEDPHLVREGEAICASVDSSEIDSVSYETSQFENALPVNYGVLQTTGSMRFVSPGPDFHPGNYKDNEHIVVFPEKKGFLSNESIRVDMIDPGEYEKANYDEKPTLVPHRAMTSYLLQLDAYPEGENPNRRRSVIGQITFANPIVGVITEDRLLNQSEEVFGIPGVDYPSARTIEPRPKGDEREGFDKLILTADRHSLILELRENPGHLDQVRVLVEAQ